MDRSQRLLDRKEFLRLVGVLGGASLLQACGVKQAITPTVAPTDIQVTATEVKQTTSHAENDPSVETSVFAFYHPFYGTPEGASGHYRGWNAPTRLGTLAGSVAEETYEKLGRYLQHDPSRLLGPRRPDTYSPQIPLLGLYDTQDTNTLTQHAQWAVEAGLDGFAWDWINELDETQIAQSHPVASFEAMLGVLRETGLPLRLAILYDGYSQGIYPPERIVKELTYVRDRYYGNPHVAHIGDRLPVMLYNAAGRHAIGDWKKVKTGLEQVGVKELMLVGGELRDIEQAREFDGISLYNTYNIMDLNEDGFRQTYSLLSHWARELSTFLALPTIPGFDNRVWMIPGSHAPRLGGKLYKTSWKIASEFSPDWYLICSWNEWGEGTQIEPDSDHGPLYLDTTRKMIRTYLGR